MKFCLNESAAGVQAAESIRRQRSVSGTSSSGLLPDFGLYLWKIQTNSVTVQLQDSQNLHFKYDLFQNPESNAKSVPNHKHAL